MVKVSRALVGLLSRVSKPTTANRVSQGYSRYYYRDGTNTILTVGLPPKLQY